MNSRDTSSSIPDNAVTFPAIPPVISSQQIQWQGFSLAYFDHPPARVDECVDAQHLLRIMDGGAVYHEWWASGSGGVGTLGKGDMILRPAEVPSRILWSNPARFTLLRFESDFIQQLIDKTDGLNQGELTVRCRFSDPVVQTLVQALIADLQAGCPAGPLYGETFGMSIAVHLLQQSLTSSPALPEYPDGLSEQARTQVLDFIEANLDQDIRLENLAQISGLSKYYFSRLFKQTMEISPHQYIIRRRIERAKGLLRQTQLSIADVALACGFGHQSHLSYHFKRIVGISPKAFRRQ